jgi:multidrug efflux pump subunit AcrB
MRTLMDARNQMLGMAAGDPRLTRVRPNGLEDVPQYRIDVDWEKAGALGVPINAIHHTISAAFGSAYVNDFIQAGRVKRVYVQADAALPHAAQRPGAALRAQKAGTMMALFRFLRFRILDPWIAASWNVQRFSRP